jgi:hypothetical protein
MAEAEKVGLKECAPSEVQMIGEKDGYFIFRDEYELSGEPNADEAVDAYLKEVDDAFLNKYPLHPNLKDNRTDQELVDHAYDLDFRIEEMKRIRGILQPDKDVFDFIDVLVDRVMAENLKKYQIKRNEIVQTLAGDERWASLLVFVPSTLWVSFFFTSTGVAGSPFTMFLGVFVLAVIASVAGRQWAGFKWRTSHRQALLKEKTHYENAVLSGAQLLASKMAVKIHAIEKLMLDVKSKLETVSRPNNSRVEQAPRLVRIMLWCPERVGLMENYYRAKMDQFVYESARIGLKDRANTESSIARGRWFFYSLLLGIVATQSLVHTPFLAPSWAPTVLSSPYWLHINFWGLTAIFFGFLILRAWFVVEHLAHYRLPLRAQRIHEIVVVSQLSQVLLGLAWSLVFVVPYLVPTEIVFGSPWLMALFSSFCFLVLCDLFLRPAHHWRRLVFLEHKSEFSSNLLGAILTKMESTRWSRYDEFRVDQRIADVFGAIYQAWFNESRKGLFGKDVDGN